jgi:hypothetical protein
VPSCPCERAAPAESIDGTCCRRFERSSSTRRCLAPIALCGIGGLYALAYLAGGSALAGALAVVTINGAVLAWLVSIPTLLGLAEGRPAREALADGYVWTMDNAVGAAALGIVTVALFVATSLLTVAVVLLFGGVAAALHVEFAACATSIDRSRRQNEVSDDD